MVEFKDTKQKMDGFLNLLFWRDYKDGHISCKDRSCIFEKIKEATTHNYYEDEESVSLDTKKILPFINKIRKQIGLLELTNSLYSGTLLERTPEVERELILKELEK